MNLVEYPDREMMMMGLADKLASALKTYLTAGESVSFAVPGGSTPAPMFDVLSGADLDWGRVHVLLTDERWLPEDHPRSNTGLLRRHLLQGRAAAARLLPLRADTDTPEEALDELSDAIAPHLPVSVMLLGMGTDMHTASLFPGADNLEAALASDAPPLMAMRAPGAPEPRITLTAPVLRGAMDVHVLIAGPDKRAALEKARTMTPVEAPIALVLGQATIHWAE